MVKLASDRVLLHIHCTKKNKQDLDRLVTVTESSSLSEVFRRALSLYDFVVTKREAGAKIQIKYPDKDRAIELEFL